MKNDAAVLLKDILSRWHAWSVGYKIIGGRTSCVMFINAKTPNHWQGLDEIADAQIDADSMKAVDFQVSEMAEPYKSAIYEDARNCQTGYAVWRSPRLPINPADRALIVAEARAQITQRLIAVGVL